jgi:hypothetical protein
MKPKKTNEDGTEKVRKPRSKPDVASMHPLDAKLHRMAQAHKLIKLADGLDKETLIIVGDELDKLRESKYPKAAE